MYPIIHTNFYYRGTSCFILYAVQDTRHQYIHHIKLNPKLASHGTPLVTYLSIEPRLSHIHPELKVRLSFFFSRGHSRL